MGRIRNLFVNLSRLTEAPPIRPGAGAPALSNRKALAGYPYDAGATGRRATAWNATRIGQNTLLWSNLENLRARSRDAIRNNPWAASAIDHFESNVVGTGIQPHWTHKDRNTRGQIQAAWNRWVRDADWMGQLDFYGLQAVMARRFLSVVDGLPMLAMPSFDSIRRSMQGQHMNRAAVRWDRRSSRWRRAPVLSAPLCCILFGLSGFEINRCDARFLGGLQTRRFMTPAAAVCQPDRGQRTTAFTPTGEHKLRRLAPIVILGHANSRERGLATVKVPQLGHFPLMAHGVLPCGLHTGDRAERKRDVSDHVVLSISRGGAQRQCGS
jgi:hypothetical protein